MVDSVLKPGYGKRADKTEKGRGYFGELPRPDGSVSTELSIGIDFGQGEQEIPLLVPTLTKDEIQHLLSGKKATKAIVDKAAGFAFDRIKAGRQPFADPDEEGTYKIPQ